MIEEISMFYFCCIIKGKFSVDKKGKFSNSIQKLKFIYTKKT